MISFGVDNRWDLPMNVPLVVTFKFDGLGFYVLPDWEDELELKSGKVENPMSG
jgi:hypothetical protein